jgi:hypothetical protein
MSNRVVLGNVGGTYCLRVSRKGDNVLSPSNPLLFDSSKSGWSGQTYAGGNASSTTSITWSATKGALSIGGANVLPLIVAADSQRGSLRVVGAVTSGLSGTDFRDNSQQSIFETTASTLKPLKVIHQNPSTSGATTITTNRTSTNLKFLVLKMPCAFGYMNATYMTPGTS